MDKRLPENNIVTTLSSRRRDFLKLLGGSVLGATAVAAGIDGVEGAEENHFRPLWDSAEVLIGNSTKDQFPNSKITCPMFFSNGDFANGFHTLDLSNLPKVRGTLTVNMDTIEPVFTSSIAVATTLGADGITYLLVAGEGKVTGGVGFFRRVSEAIIRCKYKIAAGNQPIPLLIACVDCVIILVRDS